MFGYAVCRLGLAAGQAVVALTQIDEPTRPRRGGSPRDAAAWSSARWTSTQWTQWDKDETGPRRRGPVLGELGRPGLASPRALARVLDDVQAVVAVAEEDVRPQALAASRMARVAVTGCLVTDREDAPEVVTSLVDEEAHLVEPAGAEFGDAEAGVVVGEVREVDAPAWIGLDLVHRQRAEVRGEALVERLRNRVRVDDRQVGLGRVVELHVPPAVELGGGDVLLPEGPQRDVGSVGPAVRRLVVEHQVHDPVAVADRRDLLVVLVPLAAAEEGVRQQAGPRSPVALPDDHGVVAEVLAGGDLRGEEAAAPRENDGLLFPGLSRDGAGRRRRGLPHDRVGSGVRPGGEAAPSAEDSRAADRAVRLAVDRGREPELAGAVRPCVRSRRHLEVRAERREVLVGGDQQPAVARPVPLMAVPLGELE